jgi:hypothetical protein
VFVWVVHGVGDTNNKLYEIATANVLADVPANSAAYAMMKKGNRMTKCIRSGMVRDVVQN